jgi:hypothetical protein
MKVRAERLNIGRRELSLVGLSLIITLIVFDMALKFLLPPSYQATEFGWSVGPNRKHPRTVQDTPGSIRVVTNQYFQNGFKRWGNLNHTHKTALIVGDSMTEMVYVSNGEEWYSYLENAFVDVNFFVFGAAGYGSLQEFLVLDKYYDEINPDYILWQFCSNDYHNNLYDLDIRGYPFNNHMVRPYLEGDNVVFRLPLPFSSLRSWSFIADRLLLQYDRVNWENATRDPEGYRAKQKREKEQWSEEKRQEMETLNKKAFEVTLRIMGKVRERVEDTPVYFFNLCKPLSEKEKIICATEKFQCIEGVSAHVSEMEQDGSYLRVVNNRHLNREGNQVVGEWLVDYFHRQGIFR